MSSLNINLKCCTPSVPAQVNHPPSLPNQQRWHAKWKLSRNIYAGFCTFDVIFACSVGAYIDKISAPGLSRKLIKSALLVGSLRSPTTVILSYISVCFFSFPPTPFIPRVPYQNGLYRSTLFVYQDEGGEAQQRYKKKWGRGGGREREREPFVSESDIKDYWSLISHQWSASLHLSSVTAKKGSQLLLSCAIHRLIINSLSLKEWQKERRRKAKKKKKSRSPNRAKRTEGLQLSCDKK